MKSDLTMDGPLMLSGELLKLRAWRMPDMVVYQRADDEWWLAPLDDALPLIRLNRVGMELLTSLDGRTVGSLLDRFGRWVCGPDGETGQWHLERWSRPRYSLCYFGTEPPTEARHTKWDMLLQQVREGWSGQEGFEGAQHLSEFHLREITKQDGHFDTIETTVSHLFREPSEAFQGLTYGRLLARHLRRIGWWNPKPRLVLEVGAGLGYVARELARELSMPERQGIRYLFLDLTRPFLDSQRQRAQDGGWDDPRVLQADAERLPLRDASVDLVIDNENLADLTPVLLSRQEMERQQGQNALHQEALDWIRRVRLPFDPDLPEEFIFNLGPFRFLSELWRVLKPGGRAILIEFGIEKGWPAAVKLPGHTEYEVQYSHLRHAARWLGFQEQYFSLPQFFTIRPDTQLLCTGASYSIQRFCQAEGRPFAIRAYTEAELKGTLGTMVPKLLGCHYHAIIDPAWFGLWDFKVLLVQKPGGAPRAAFQDTKGFRWYSQR
jgi:ubiquinone/menaquinone biosynthesis C-methylase UbiE